MNNKSITDTVFPETAIASKLMNDFTGLVRRQKRERQKTIASEAALSFFDKTVLTISEFFEPIGFDLRIPAPAQISNDSVKNFFRASFGGKTSVRKFTEQPQNIIPENAITQSPLPAMTIKRFFDPL